MSDITIHEAVTVWMAGGQPARIVWRNERYRVSDTPTPLVETVAHPLITHPFERVAGWRFQATDGAGHTRVFDVRQRSTETWELLRVWD